MRRQLFSLSLLAVSMPLLADGQPPPIIDRTGTYLRLDIDKILESTDLTSFCGIQPAQLKYLDHAGGVHLLEYQVAGQCSNEN